MPKLNCPTKAECCNYGQRLPCVLARGQSVVLWMLLHEDMLGVGFKGANLDLYFRRLMLTVNC